MTTVHDVSTTTGRTLTIRNIDDGADGVVMRPVPDPVGELQAAAKVAEEAARLEFQRLQQVHPALAAHIGLSGPA